MGCGKKMKHLDTSYFFVQNLIKDKTILIAKVPTDENLADIGTKYLSEKRLIYLLNLMGCFYIT